MRELIPPEVAELWLSGPLPTKTRVVRLLHLVAVAAAVGTCLWALAAGEPPRQLAALVLLGAIGVLEAGVLALWAWWCWRSSPTSAGRCERCAAVWAGRTEFVGGHRHNEPRSVRWWMWRRLPGTCPQCQHPL